MERLGDGRSDSPVEILHSTQSNMQGGGGGGGEGGQDLSMPV